MDKYFLKPEYIGCDIVTAMPDGTQILITDKIFNDYFAELLLSNGASHLIMLNPRWNENNNTEKKSYIQVSENHIILTSKVDLTEENEQKKIVNEQESKQKGGRGRPKKA